MKQQPGAPVRFGVVGCGVIAYWVHLRILQHLSGAKLVAASDPDAGARERAGRIAKIPIVEQSSELLERDDIDAVVICSPTDSHAAVAIAACNAGKHVFLEKPIATSASDARRVMHAAEAAGVCAVLGFNRRLHPMYEQARSLIKTGVLGRVHAVQSAFCEPMTTADMSPWRRTRTTGGGVMLDLASHHIDLFRWFLDDEIESVSAQITSAETEHDTATVAFNMCQGTSVQSFFSYRTARADFIEFIGEKGSLKLDRHEPRFVMKVARRFGYGTRTRRVIPSAGSTAWRLKRVVRPSVEPSYQHALAAFVDAIHGGSGRVATFADGVVNIDVIAAAESSTLTGSTTLVNDGSASPSVDNAGQLTA